MEPRNNEGAQYLKMDAELRICCFLSLSSGLSAVVTACGTVTLITTLNTLTGV